MKLVLSLLLSFALTAAATAAGLPFAIHSLDKAKDLVKQAPDKHILVFYSSPS